MSLVLSRPVWLSHCHRSQSEDLQVGYTSGVVGVRRDVSEEWTGQRTSYLRTGRGGASPRVSRVPGGPSSRAVVGRRNKRGEVGVGVRSECPSSAPLLEGHTTRSSLHPSLFFNVDVVEVGGQTSLLCPVFTSCYRFQFVYGPLSLPRPPTWVGPRKFRAGDPCSLPGVESERGGDGPKGPRSLNRVTPGRFSGHTGLGHPSI